MTSPTGRTPPGVFTTLIPFSPGRIPAARLATRRRPFVSGTIGQRVNWRLPPQKPVPDCHLPSCPVKRCGSRSPVPGYPIGTRRNVCGRSS